jgi:hypothetical protein
LQQSGTPTPTQENPVKLQKLFLDVRECVKYDGKTNRVSLHSVQLDDGRYVDDAGCVAKELDKFGWPEWDDHGLDCVELDDSEYSEFEDLVQRVKLPGWVYTSNPAVYGYPDESFEVCGVQVHAEDVDAHCYDPCDKRGREVGPYVVELNVPAKLVDSSLEPNYHNTDGCALTLYFEGKPDEATVKQACKDLRGKHVVGVDPDDPEFNYEERETPVSERARLHRYQVHPTG